jgi:glutathione S-transferase
LLVTACAVIICNITKGCTAQALGWLDSFVNDNKFMAGNNLTIADISLLATYSTIKAAGVRKFFFTIFLLQILVWQY